MSSTGPPSSLSVLLGLGLVLLAALMAFLLLRRTRLGAAARRLLGLPPVYLSDEALHILKPHIISERSEGTSASYQDIPATPFSLQSGVSAQRSPSVHGEFLAANEAAARMAAHNAVKLADSLRASPGGYGEGVGAFEPLPSPRSLSPRAEATASSQPADPAPSATSLPSDKGSGPTKTGPSTFDELSAAAAKLALDAEVGADEAFPLVPALPQPSFQPVLVQAQRKVPPREPLQASPARRAPSDLPEPPPSDPCPPRPTAAALETLASVKDVPMRPDTTKDVPTTTKQSPSPPPGRPLVKELSNDEILGLRDSTSLADQLDLVTQATANVDSLPAGPLLPSALPLASGAQVATASPARLARCLEAVPALDSPLRGALGREGLLEEDGLELGSGRMSRASLSSEDGALLDSAESRGMRRAASSDSIDSSCSALELTSAERDLGLLELRIGFNKTAQSLSVWALEAFDVRTRAAEAEVWLVFFLLPHPRPLWRTQLQSGPHNPKFHEEFRQCVREKDLHRVALLCQVYARYPQLNEKEAELVGQCRVRLKDVCLSPPQSLCLAVLPAAAENETDSVGELLFALSYLPTSERLTLVLSKLKLQARPDGSYPSRVRFRAYLVIGSRVLKKKTEARDTHEGVLLCNDSVLFSLSPGKFPKAHLRVTVVEAGPTSSDASKVRVEDERSLGHVTLGSRSSGKELGHWTKVSQQPRKPIAMWHSVRPKPAKV